MKKSSSILDYTVCMLCSEKSTRTFFIFSSHQYFERLVSFQAKLLGQLEDLKEILKKGF